MNRRGFLSLFGAGVAGLALEQAIPLGRVWSFPKEIVVCSPHPFDFTSRYERSLQQMFLLLEEFHRTHPTPPQAKLIAHAVKLKKLGPLGDQMAALLDPVTTASQSES